MLTWVISNEMTSLNASLKQTTIIFFIRRLTISSKALCSWCCCLFEVCQLWEYNYKLCPTVFMQGSKPRVANMIRTLDMCLQSLPYYRIITTNLMMQILSRRKLVSAWISSQSPFKYNSWACLRDYNKMSN